MTVGGECSGTAVLGGELMMNAMPDCFAGTGRRQGFNMPTFSSRTMDERKCSTWNSVEKVIDSLVACTEATQQNRRNV